MLKLLATGKSKRAIGLALGVTEETIKFHVNNILHELNVSDHTQAAIAAFQRGIASP